MKNPRHLIVDGANLVRAWPDLRKLAAVDLVAARALLVQRLVAIHDVEQVRVTVVFDGRGDQLTIEHPFTHPTLSVVYTPSSLTADDVIEHMVAHSADPGECFVATDDQAELQTVSATGAATLRSKDLLAWVERATSRQTSAAKNLRDANTKSWKMKSHDASDS